MFLGKYSARNASSGQALADAPLGIPYLRKIINLLRRHQIEYRIRTQY
jgi:hypothetical protein